MLSAFIFSQVMVTHHVGNAGSPVIEVACHQQGGVAWNLSLDVVLQLLNLADSAGWNQA